MEWVIGIGLFVAAILIVEGIILFFRPRWDPESRSIERRLEKFAGSEGGEKTIDVIRRRQLSDVARLHQLLAKMRVMHRLDELVVQANSRLNLPYR